MTIDEAIAHEKNIVDNKKQYAKIHCVTQEFYADIDYHEQLAEWLEEFKELKEKSVPKKPIRQPNHDMTYEEVLCPRCSGSVSKYTNPYCECGQNLDWK